MNTTIDIYLSICCLPQLTLEFSTCLHGLHIKTGSKVTTCKVYTFFSQNIGIERWSLLRMYVVCIICSWIMGHYLLLDISVVIFIPNNCTVLATVSFFFFLQCMISSDHSLTLPWFAIYTHPWPQYKLIFLCNIYSPLATVKLNLCNICSALASLI